MLPVTLTLPLGTTLIPSSALPRMSELRTCSWASVWGAKTIPLPATLWTAQWSMVSDLPLDEMNSGRAENGVDTLDRQAAQRHVDARTIRLCPPPAGRERRAFYRARHGTAAAEGACVLRSSRNGGRKIIDAAYESGFNDLSHFNRCFRRRFGETPIQVRGAGAKGPVPPRRHRLRPEVSPWSHGWLAGSPHAARPVGSAGFPPKRGRAERRSLRMLCNYL